jgi:uncharacterized RDD family membrane protein YckC
VDNPCRFGVNQVHDSRKNTAAGTEQAVTSELPPAIVRDAEPAGESLIRRRFAAAGIDLVLLCCGVLLLGQVQWVFASFALGLFMARDWDDGYSPGKRVFNLIALRPSGRPCTLGVSLARNVTLLPPMLFIELAMLLFSGRGTRLGDILADTTVQFRGRAAPAPAVQHREVSRTTASDDVCIDEPPAHNDDDAEACDDAGADPMVIDPGLLTPEKLRPEELAAARQAEHESEGKPDEPAATSVDLDAAARCIGIEGEATPGSLDDAYWTYVGRYSPDAARDLDEDELRLRCGELADREASHELSAPGRLPERTGRSDCLQYLNDWFVVINKCRDALA